MAPIAKTSLQSKFGFSSSISDDVRHPSKSPEAYECWYFDAVSDDGTKAVVITFLDNYTFSTSNNSQLRENSQTELNLTKEHHAKALFPAISFAYYCEGKTVYREICEFSESDFESDFETPGCRIENNSFQFESAPYGSGYVISLDLKLSGNKQLKANFEWLSIESDFLHGEKPSEDNLHEWNLVAPRSDVTGRIEVAGKNGPDSDEIVFRGSGYHDHSFDSRWLPDTVKSLQRGRVHFPDSTAVFYRCNEIGDVEPCTKLVIVQNDELIVSESSFDIENSARSIFGLKYPEEVILMAENQMSLKAKQQEIIESSFFYVRFLSSMTLTMDDGKLREGVGIMEYLAPAALKYRWLDWISGLKIGR